MATAITFNDFRYGMVSEYMRRRLDLAMYQKSASLIENAVPMRTGGVRLRPGTERLTDLSSIGALRLIPFTISVREHYLLVLSLGKLYIYGLDISSHYVNVSGEGFTTPYTTQDEIYEIQSAQDYEKVILVQRYHPPIVVQRSSLGGWNVGNITLDAVTDAYDYSYDEEGNETASAVTYDYAGLFTTNNFPSVVAFHASRLWMGSSMEHPYRMWASKPFESFNFQTEEYYNYLDESITVNQYMDAVAGAGERREELDDGNFWIVTKTVDANTGVVVMTSVIQDEDGTVLGHREYDPESDSWGDPIYDNASWSYSYNYTKPVQKLDSVIREDSALMLDMASDRDETISWLASTGDLIYVGTASSERVMPSSIHALSQTITKVGSYGSKSFLQSCYGARNIFYVQSGGRLLRSISSSSAGTAYRDLTYQCSDILSSGVRSMAWQRVPEPRLFCVLNDGTIAVLCYDEDYDLDAWCRWTSDLDFMSIAVIDTEEGQEVFALAADDKGGRFMMRFSEGLYKDDGQHAFTARLITNNLDAANAMMYTKKSYRIAADSMHTRFKARVNDKSQSSSFSYSRDLVMLWNWTQPTDTGLRVEFESFPGEDMILLAVMIETEASA